MLEKIVKVVNDFQEMYDAEKAKLKAEMTRIEKTYNPMGTEYNTAKIAARNAFNEKIEKERIAANEKIQMYANSDRKELADITSKPAPEDALTTIELLKAGNPESTSEFEVRSILDKYNGNYLATKMIVQITDAAKRFGIMFSPADEIIDNINEIERMAFDLVRQYNGNASYAQSVLLNGKIIMNVNERVQNFLNGEYCKTFSETMRRAVNA